MSDDQPTRGDSDIPFSQRVTINTLTETDRPPTHTFDMDLFQQDPGLTVRLEGRFTDVRGGSRPIPNNAILMFSSEGNSFPPTVMYNKDTGQREPAPDGSDFSGVFQAVREAGTVRHISVGDRVDVSFISFGNQGFAAENEKKTTATLEIESIRCGHIS